MNRKKFFTFLLLLTGVVLSTGIGQGIFAQTRDGNEPALATPGEKRSGTSPQQKYKLSKRNLMMIEQAESARMRAEKILGAPQGNTETPKK
jgi:hypothetical protein